MRVGAVEEEAGPAETGWALQGAGNRRGSGAGADTTLVAAIAAKAGTTR